MCLEKKNNWVTGIGKSSSHQVFELVDTYLINNTSPILIEEEWVNPNIINKNWPNIASSQYTSTHRVGLEVPYQPHLIILKHMSLPAEWMTYRTGKKPVTTSLKYYT